MHMSIGVSTAQEVVSDPKLLELLLYDNQLAWVLGSKLKYPAMTVHCLTVKPFIEPVTVN